MGIPIPEHGLLTPSYPETHESLQSYDFPMACRVSPGSTPVPLASHLSSVCMCQEQSKAKNGKEVLLPSFYVEGI